jgi:twitching motility protein PilT
MMQFERDMADEPVIAPILDLIENETYTDIFLRARMETRVKTPRGWLPISQLAKGTRPHVPQRQWLSAFVAQMSGNDRCLEEMVASEKSVSFMFPFDQREIRLRCKVALCADTLSDGADFTVHIRNLPIKVPPLQALGLPQIITQMLSPAGGLVIVTGQICSGKTTTLASLVNYINDNRYANIISLEYLTEYIFQSNKSIITQRTVPHPVPTFLEGIQDALDGQAVDVMMIGEVVDKQTMDAMLRAAESGHLILATMHARNPVGAISRVIDMFSGDEQRLRLGMLADKLIGVIAQKLLPHRSGDRYVLGYEILRNTKPAVAEAIRQNNAAQLQSQIQQGAEEGMVTLNQTLRKLVKEQILDSAVALEAAYDKSELKEMLK